MVWGLFEPSCLLTFELPIGPVTTNTLQANHEGLR